jgi:hypothetical protein
MPETAFKGSRRAKALSNVGVAAHRKDPQALAAARRELATEKIAHYVNEVLAAAPPLTEEQRSKLAELLKPTRVGGAA